MKKIKFLSILLVIFILSGCFNTVKENDLITIKWYLSANIESEDFQLVMQEVNKILAQRYELQLEIIANISNYDKEMELINASKTEYDLAFTASWRNDYHTNVAKGACLDITDYLPVYAPKLYEQTDAAVWEAVSVNGRIYAVPNWQIQAKALGFSAPTEYLEAANITVDEINTLEDIEKYMQELVKVHPEANKVRPSWAQVQRYYGFLDVLGEGMPGVINYKQGGKPVVINQYATQEYENYIKLRRSWVEKGYMHDSYLPQDISTSVAEKKEVRQRPYTLHIFVPDNEANLYQDRGYAWTNKQMSDAVLDAGGVLAALTHVSSTTKHPEEAVKMLEIINTDAEIYNLLVWGIEGKHYTKVSENKVKPVENRKYYGIEHFLIGSQKNGYIIETAADDVIQQISDFNTSAILSPILGFAADTRDISTEISNCIAIVNKRSNMLDLGLVDAESGLEEFQKELEEAGVNTIIAELQRQIDIWWETK